MATIVIETQGGRLAEEQTFRGVGKIEKIEFSGIGVEYKQYVLTIPRMSETRFENVVFRVLIKNLTEQGITPISITYSE